MTGVAAVDANAIIDATNAIKNLTQDQIDALLDPEDGGFTAYELWVRLRWPETGGLPICPRCGTQDAYYHLCYRGRFTCILCASQFSVTSGSIFSSAKLDLPKLIAIMALALNDVSCMEISRRMGVQYRTAWDLKRKVVVEYGTTSPPQPRTKPSNES